jgi:hypothetical protein
MHAKVRPDSILKCCGDAFEYDNKGRELIIFASKLCTRCAVKKSATSQNSDEFSFSDHSVITC